MPARSTPVIGLATYRQSATWGSWERPAALLASAYVDVVAAAGGAPVLVPPADALEAGGAEAPGTGRTPPAPAYAIASALDALVLVGGEDVEPSRYGAGAAPRTVRTNALRDAHEMALLAACLDAGIPVLAVCRGMQLLNVYLGGTLHQHLPDLSGGPDHQSAPGVFSETEIDSVAGSAVAKIMGERFVALCSHHQAVDRVAGPLAVTAHAVGDGVVEAVEMKGRDFVVGVQWHPEESRDTRLFAALVEAARLKR